MRNHSALACRSQAHFNNLELKSCKLWSLFYRHFPFRTRRESAFFIQPMPETICIEFGRYACAITCSNQEIIEFLDTHFAGYHAAAQPDATITINVIPAIKSSLIIPGNRFTYSIRNEQFNFGPDLIQGTWDARNRICTIAVCDFILTSEEVWLFDRFLCRLFYTLSLERDNEKGKTIILHSAGIERNGKGYIFFGGPGSGKSTICQSLKKVYCAPR